MSDLFTLWLHLLGLAVYFGSGVTLVVVLLPMAAQIPASRERQRCGLARPGAPSGTDRVARRGHRARAACRSGEADAGLDRCRARADCLDCVDLPQPDPPRPGTGLARLGRRVGKGQRDSWPATFASPQRDHGWGFQRCALACRICADRYRWSALSLTTLPVSATRRGLRHRQGLYPSSVIHVMLRSERFTQTPWLFNMLPNSACLPA